MINNNNDTIEIFENLASHAVLESIQGLNNVEVSDSRSKIEKKITQTNSGSFNKSVASAPLPQKNH